MSHPFLSNRFNDHMTSDLMCLDSMYAETNKPTAWFGKQMPITLSRSVSLEKRGQHSFHQAGWHRKLRFSVRSRTLFVEIWITWNVPHMWEDAFFYKQTKKNAPVSEEQEWESRTDGGRSDSSETVQRMQRESVKRKKREIKKNRKREKAREREKAL